MAKHKRSRKIYSEPLKFPWTLLRPLFGVISLVLFLVCLHSLIFVTYIAYNSPDCSKCPEYENQCYHFCNGTVEDFIYIYDQEDRAALLTYTAVVLLLRCFAFFAGFVGVFTFMFLAMIFYLILHLGLIITFVSTIVFYAVQEKPVYEYAFGKTTFSTISLSIAYSLELILFVIGLNISFKFFRTKVTENKDKKENKVTQITARSDIQ